jgi:hypothetical protein
MIKAHAVRLFGMALALAGFLGAVYFSVLRIWPDAIALVPALNAEAWLRSWLPDRVHPGVVLAALGALMVLAGVLIAVRQTALIRAEKGRREDRLRRVRQYRADEARQQLHESRLEPFIGPGSATGKEADRRVA